MSPVALPVRACPDPVDLPPGRPAVITLAEAMERSRTDREHRGYVQGALALEPPAVPEESESTTEEDDEDFFGPQFTASVDLPDPRPVAAQLGVAIAEIMAGVRPPSQVLRWTTPEVYDIVAQRATTAARRLSTPSGRTMPRPRIRLLRVHLCRPADGVAEASVVLADGPRTRAMALRLSGMDGRWRVQVLEFA